MRFSLMASRFTHAARRKLTIAQQNWRHECHFATKAPEGSLANLSTNSLGTIQLQDEILVILYNDEKRLSVKVDSV